MKKKVLTTTYLRGVDKYNIRIDLSHEDYYLVIKDIISVDEEFISNNFKLPLFNNYKIIEILPKDENYAVRFFLDENGNRLETYFDINRGNMIDVDYRVPYYIDLYTDVTYNNGVINVLDENELIDAYNSGEISSEDVLFVNSIRDKILKELREGTNRFINIDINELLK